MAVFVICATLVGGWSARAQAQVGVSETCPVEAIGSSATGEVVLFLSSAQNVIGDLNEIEAAIVAKETDFQAGWTRRGDFGEFAKGLLDEATVLEGLASSLAQRDWPISAAEELSDVRFVIERYLDGDATRSGLDDSRTQSEALRFNGDGGSTLCGIVSTMQEVMGFVATGADEEAELADTGVESKPVILAGIALVVVGATLMMASYRRGATEPARSG